MMNTLHKYLESLCARYLVSRGYSVSKQGYNPLSKEEAELYGQSLEMFNSADVAFHKRVEGHWADYLRRGKRQNG